MPDASDQKPPYNMLSGNSSDGTYTSSPRTLYGSENGHDFPGIEVFVADQTPELVPVERSPSLSQPQRFPIHEPKPWLKFMKPKQEQNEKTPPPKDNDTNSSRRRRRWRLWLLLTILAVGIIIALAIALPLSLRPRARESRYEDPDRMSMISFSADFQKAPKQAPPFRHQKPSMELAWPYCSWALRIRIICGISTISISPEKFETCSCRITNGFLHP